MAATYLVKGGLRAYFGTSTDKKPAAGVPNGSSFYEMDAGRLYLFDEQRREWLWQPERGGSGSGGSGGVTDHRSLTGRDAEEQHPMNAITGLAEALAAKVGAEAVEDAVAQNIHELTRQDVLNVWNSI